jgi:predicted secreted hydrolase
MMRGIFVNMKVLQCVLFIVFLSFSASYAGEYLDVMPDYTVKIPDDFYYKKDYRVQWWYFTGHLFTDSGREFGYEIAFFVVNVQKRDYKSRFGINNVYISHFAVSDIMKNKFYFHDKTDTGAFGFAGAEDNRLKVWVERDTLEGTVTNISLKASDMDKSIALQLLPKKQAILNGEKGYSRKSETSPLISSIYFSYTNIETEGVLKIGDDELGKYRQEDLRIIKKDGTGLPYNFMTTGRLCYILSGTNMDQSIRIQRGHLSTLTGATDGFSRMNFQSRF